MGLLDKLFKSDAGETNKVSSSPWTKLTDKDQIEIATEESKDKLVGIFKHSTRCGISNMVLKTFEREYVENDGVKLYFLDLIKHREISNAVASELGVQHESPQFIVLSDEKVIYHASHQDINASKLKELS